MWKKISSQKLLDHPRLLEEVVSHEYFGFPNKITDSYTVAAWAVYKASHI